MQTKNGSYTLGLDIGIASVGWAVLAENRIVDIGVRCFDKAETAKEGDSLNLIRRTARLMRRRLARRAERLKKLAREMKRCGLITDTHFFNEKATVTISPWELRVQGLDRKLENDDWARVIYHLCKHRGFYWVSRAERKQMEGEGETSEESASKKTAADENGQIKKSLSANKRRMAEKSYRTVGEMVLAEFPNAQRNKAGEYEKALPRVLLGEELTLLFAKQRDFGNPHATADFEAEILGNGDKKSGLFWQQKPALTGEKLLESVGFCTFEKAEHRAPKAAFTAERHVWLTRLNNLRITTDGITRSLNEAERQYALPLPYQQANDFSYKQLSAALVKGGFLAKESFKFAGLSYPSEKQKAEGKAKDPESDKLVKLPAWQELRKTLENAGLKTEWEGIAGAAMGGNPETLDEIARILSVFKEDDEASRELGKLPLPNKEKMIDALLNVRFDKFSNLSLKALRKIVPQMETGLRYDEACLLAGYHHSQIVKLGTGAEKYLPSFYESRDKTGRLKFSENDDIPRNPVVLRALNQSRKVVNALIKKYGAPFAVHIEMARDLSNPLDERRKIETEQKNYRDRNEKVREDFAHIFGALPKGAEFEKYRLFKEQQSQCAYSQNRIDVNRLLETGYVEIDHALPYSRSFDDSKNNKVLVLAAENRNKGNKTPYEYLDGKGNSPRWRAFAAWVEGNKSYRMAKRSRLLKRDFGDKEAAGFRERNLNDTRYICRFFKNYVEKYLQLAEGSEAKRCVVLSGQMTAFLRARWGVGKIRAESDRHHALDAAVVAAASHSMVKRLSDYSRRHELKNAALGFVDPETGEIPDIAAYARNKEHFPEPWAYFREELEVRVKMDNPEALREELARLGTYSEDDVAEISPLFVSRAAQRKNGGAAHKDTIYGQKTNRLKKEGSVTQKKALSNLSMSDLDNLVDPDRNEKLYAAIRKRLDEYGGKADKAFAKDKPFYKPVAEGKIAPLVRKVTVVINKLTGIPIRGGVAENKMMLRVDVFTKAGKFYLVPVYVHHRVTGLPNRAVVQGKDEEEWTLIDETFGWCFSIHPNDFVRVTQKGKAAIEGYYSGINRNNGSLKIWVHDRNEAIGDKGFIDGVGVKTALSIEKFNIDVLGNRYPANPEPRRGL